VCDRRIRGDDWPCPKTTRSAAAGARDNAFLGGDELRLQRCNSCDKTFLPPWPFCPSHASLEVSVIRGSGEGRLYNYLFVTVAPPVSNRT
jgi:uncharacterized OB-fold protein